MISVTDIRNRLIDQLMSIKDAEYLRTLSDMIDRSQVQEQQAPLTEEQKVMQSFFNSLIISCRAALPGNQ